MDFRPSIEIPLFLATVGYWLTFYVNKNLLIYRTCYAYLSYNKSDCALLGFVNNNITRKLENIVQPYANNISLVETIIHSILSSILGLFIAPWSDRFGRKPVIINGLIGGIASLGLHIIFAAVDDLSPWFILTLSLPVFITGGRSTFLTAVSAYLADSSTKVKRGFRMGVFEMVMTVAILIGNTTSSYVLIATNYVTVYCISAVLHILALAIVVFFISESLRERERENKIRGLLKFSNISEMIKTPFKARRFAYRKILLLVMVCLLLGDLAIGESRLMFNFLRRKFHWTFKHFTWYSSSTKVLEIIGTFFVVYLLHTVLRIKESILLFVGLIFFVISYVLVALANEDWQIYLAAILALPTSGENALTKSLLSKLVDENEIAKVYSILGIASSILGPLSSAGYNALYNITISTNPGLYKLVSATISFLGVIIYMAILIIEKRSSAISFEVLENENEDSNTEHVNSVNADIDNQEEHISH